MTPSEAYAKMLAAQGLVVKADSDGRLQFKYEGEHYVLLTYADDSQYVGLSATYRLPAGVRRQQALTQANELTRHSKVVKVYVLADRGVTVAAEQLVGTPEDLESVLLRLIRLVQSITFTYFSNLAKSTIASA